MINHLKRREGSSLILVMIMISVLSIIALSLGVFVVNEAKYTAMYENKTQAYYIARAGASATAKWLSNMTASEFSQFNTLTFPLHSNNNSFGNGAYDIEITKQGQQLIVQSTGKVNNTTDMITIVLNRTNGVLHVDNTAISCIGKIEAKNNATITGNILTNTNAQDIIKFSNSSGIAKDSLGNFTGNIFLQYGANTTIVNWGSSLPKPAILNSSSSVNYATPSFPSFPTTLPSMGTIVLSGINHSISGKGDYTSIVLKNNAVLTYTITGTVNDILRIRDFDMESNSQFIISGQGKLTLYIDKISKFTLCKLNADGDMNNLDIYCNNSFNMESGAILKGSMYFGANSSNITLRNDTTFAGNIVVTSAATINLKDTTTLNPTMIYAPNSNIVMETNSSVTGGIIANQISMLNNSKVIIIRNADYILQGVTGVAKYTTAYWK